MDEKKGIKHDSGKNRIGLMLRDFAHVIECVGHVTTFGAAKYAPSNWLHVENAKERYFDAFNRHYFAHLQGIELDEESGLPHLHHAMWNLLAYAELIEREKGGEND